MIYNERLTRKQQIQGFVLKIMSEETMENLITFPGNPL